MLKVQNADYKSARESFELKGFVSTEKVNVFIRSGLQINSDGAEFFVDMKGLSDGMYIAAIQDETGKIHSTKLMHSNAGSNGRRTVNLENVVNNTLKNATLSASEKGTNYKLVVDDVFDNLKAGHKAKPEYYSPQTAEWCQNGNKSIECNR